MEAAFDVVARFAVAGQALHGHIHFVQRGQHPVHFIVDRAALGLRHAGQGLVPQHAALHKLHNVKRPPNDRFVVAQHMHLGHGHVGAVQAFHDRKFALDGVG